MRRFGHVIGAARGEATSTRWLPVFDPAHAQPYAQVADGDAADVEAAIAAAEAAAPAWAALRPSERARHLERLADALEARLDAFAHAEAIDAGKPLALARDIEIPRAISNLRFFAHAATQFASESHHGEAGLNYTLRLPLGVVGCISPWNLPLYLFTWKIAPALAAGNCVIAKPSEVTPMTAYLFSELCIKAGLPKGVLSIVHGLGPKVGNAIVSHPDITVISFTGGTSTGKHIASVAAPMFKKLSLELGGKNPNIVFDDCDFDKAVETSVRASFTNQGEICLCGSRIFVQRGIYDKFRDAFVEKAKKMTVGDPKLDTSKMGAIVSKQHFEKVLSYIDLAKEEGGKILLGGHAVQPEGRCSTGWFIAPTVIENLAHDCRTNTEEIFGPVVTLTPFDTEDDALLYANCTTYGLASTVWTENLTRAHRVAAKIKSGIVWINCWLLRDLRTPFGGTKQSGVGREGGWEALRFFTEPKNVCVKL